MPRFFVPPEALERGGCIITGDAARRLARVRRTRPGEQIVVVADGATEHGVRVDTLTADRVEGTIIWSRAAAGEPVLHVEILQAIPQHGMDDAVEYLTEVGAAVIRPVITERTIRRPDERRSRDRAARWQVIAANAAELAFRAKVPAVHPAAALRDALDSLPSNCRLLAGALEVPCLPLNEISVAQDRPLALAIGPEGGWASADLTALGRAGAEFVHLGPRVLPACLAGTVALAVLLAGAGEWQDEFAMPPEKNA